ncbi:MAG: substrate-binding domain-containing protein [Actinomycetota bacterium]|nr:substrate-binding domain-containing protein [Actinomycetota bacterium]
MRDSHGRDRKPARRVSVVFSTPFIRLAVLAAATLALWATGCAGEERGGEGGALAERSRPTVRIAVDGSDLLSAFATRAGEQFEAFEPAVDVVVESSGTGEAFKRLCVGQAAVVNAARPITQEERAVCRQNGIFIRQFPIANAGLAVGSGKDLGIRCVTVAELRELWRAGSRGRSYASLDPSFPRRPVHLFGPPAGADSFDIFTAEVNGAEGRAREDYLAVGDARSFAERVATEPGALGYFSFAELEEARDRLSFVAIDAGEGCVHPSRATIQSGRYRPLSRPLDMYVSLEALRRLKVSLFLDLVLDRSEHLANATGVVPATRSQLGRARNVVGMPPLPTAEPQGEFE